MPDLIFFFQAVLEGIYFFTQNVVDFQFLLYHLLQLINIGINIVINKPLTLNLRNQLALLSQQFSIFFYGSHMCCKYFFLLFKDISDFFLKGKIFLFVLIFHCSFHSTYIFLHFFLFLSPSIIFNFNFLCNLILTFFFFQGLFVSTVLVHNILFD